MLPKAWVSSLVKYTWSFFKSVTRILQWHRLDKKIMFTYWWLNNGGENCSTSHLFLFILQLLNYYVILIFQYKQGIYNPMSRSYKRINKGKLFYLSWRNKTTPLNNLFIYIFIGIADAKLVVGYALHWQLEKICLFWVYIHLLCDCHIF